jgi:tetratricopeptide (TPR) repeat protein
MEGIEGLVSRSLVQQGEDDTGEARFWMLETIHEYAREKLAESGEEEELRRQHLGYYLKLAEEIGPGLTGESQRECLERLEEEYDNIRAALQWARRGGKDKGQRRGAGPGDADDADDAEQGLKLAAAIGRFWYVLGKYHEGREYLEGALSSVSSVSLVPDPHSTGEGVQVAGTQDQERMKAKAQAFYTVAWIAHNQGDLVSAQANFEKALEMGRFVGDRMLTASCLSDLAMIASMAGDYTKEQSLQEQSLSVLREVGDKAAVAAVLRSLGQRAQLHGNYASARSLYEQGLAAAREAGNSSLVAGALGDLGWVDYEQGDYADARSFQEQSLAILRETGNKMGVAFCLYTLGLAADAQGDHKAAISLFRESLNLHREAGNRIGISQCLAGWGDWAGVRVLGEGQSKDQKERAVRLLAAASAQYEAMHYTIRPRDFATFEAGLSRARAQLGSEAFEKAWQEGRVMSMEQAVEYALEEGQ